MLTYEPLSSHPPLRYSPFLRIKIHADLKQLPLIRGVGQGIALGIDLGQRLLRRTVPLEFKNVDIAVCLDDAVRPALC